MAQKKKTNSKKTDIDAGMIDKETKMTNEEANEVVKYIKGATKTKEFNTIVGKIQKAYDEKKNSVKDFEAKFGNTYTKTYPALLSFAKACTKDSDDRNRNIQILALAVYGWMPTILKNDKNDSNVELGAVCAAIDALSNGDIENADGVQSLDLLCRFINNSYTGTSKFLHFLFPQHFAIFDSRIENALKQIGVNGKINDHTFLSGYKHPIWNATSFILYELAMREVAKRTGRRLNDDEKLRAVEKVFFYCFRQNEGQKESPKTH